MQETLKSLQISLKILELRYQKIMEGVPRKNFLEKAGKVLSAIAFIKESITYYKRAMDKLDEIQGD